MPGNPTFLPPNDPPIDGSTEGATYPQVPSDEARQFMLDHWPNWDIDWNRALAALSKLLRMDRYATGEACAQIAEHWASSLRPGHAQRLAGHQEAAREIAGTIRETFNGRRG